MRPHLDGHEVLRKLGTGGMAEVWLSTSDGASYALKVLARDDPRSAARMRSEGALQGALDHPNVVAVHGMAQSAGRPVLILEYVEGVSLAELLARMPRWTPAEIDAVARGVLAGVAAAHARGWVHRDLKPSNVLLARTATSLVPKVADFGLAQVFDAGNAPGTWTRQGVGTRRYMSREQVMGRPPTPAMDVFALGALLHELIEGRPAFANPEVWQACVERGQRPVRTRVVPDRMTEAVHRALAPVGERPADAAELLAVWAGDAPLPEAPFRTTLLDAAHPTAPPSAAPLGDDLSTAAVHRPLAPLGSQLAVPPDRFVGRARLRAEVQQALVPGRLVLLHGPPGVGKSRLATELALALAERFEGGVGHAPMADVHTRQDLVGAVAQALGVPPAVDTAATEQRIAWSLADRGPTLLVLDDLQPLPPDAWEPLDAWLRTTTTVLGTSRRGTGQASEHRVAIAPLAPDEGAELLRDRLARAAPSPALDPTVLEAISERLDGLPLALELAVGRLRRMAPEQLLARLDRPLGVGPGLARALEASWAQLPEDAQRALARLSLFRGGFDADGAEAVIGHPDALDLLDTLLDHGLVQARPAPVPVGGQRFELLQTVRTFAGGRLGAGERAEGEARHRAWVVQVLTGTRPTTERGWVRQHARERLERANAEAAWARAPEDAPDLLALGLAFGERLGGQATVTARDRFWGLVVARAEARRAWDTAARGLSHRARLQPALGAVDRGQEMVDRAFALAEDPVTKAWVGRAQGELHFARGRAAEAQPVFAAAAAEVAAAGDTALHASMLADAAYCAAVAGDPATGVELIERALALHSEGAWAPGVHMMAVPVFQAAGRIERALEHAMTGQRLFEGRGDGARAARAQNNVAAMVGELGQTREAMEVFDAVARAQAALGDRGRQALARSNLAQAALELGDLARAERALGQALALYQVLGDPQGEGRCRTLLGVTAHLQGRLADAAAQLDAALGALADVSYPRWQQLAQVHRAAVGVRLGDADALDAIAPLITQPEPAAVLDVLRQLTDGPIEPKAAWRERSGTRLALAVVGSVGSSA